MKALPPGPTVPHTRLWEAQYRLIWSSRTDTTPAYKHISTWVNATIDYPDGDRWAGEFYRCREGIKRLSYDDKFRDFLPRYLLGVDA